MRRERPCISTWTPSFSTRMEQRDHPQNPRQACHHECASRVRNRRAGFCGEERRAGELSVKLSAYRTDSGDYERTQTNTKIDASGAKAPRMPFDPAEKHAKSSAFKGGV